MGINVASEEFGLSEGLVEAVNAWAEEFEETYRPDGPYRSGFDDQATRGEFYARGLELAGLLGMELGDGAEVRYFDGRTSETYIV